MVECPGFVPKKDAIKTDVKNNVLTVSGREEDKQEGGDFSVREFKKTYKLPENVQHEKMISFMPVEGTLVLEFPLKETTGHLNEDLMPRIVETSQGGKAVTINFGVPKNIEPSKVHVVIKDRDLIVKADDISKDKYTTSKIHYYKRATLPPNTDFERLQCKWDDNNKISCTAPLKTEVRAVRNVPIEQPLKLTK
jgi:HSP20 family molecular chaperone IbpA